jgi:hypothetical protein
MVAGMNRIRWVAIAVTLGSALLVASPTQAALTLGQLGPPGSNPAGCNDGSFIVQTGVAAGPDYRVPPGGGVITGWSARTFSTGGPDQILQLAVFGNDVSGNLVTFEGLSAFEHLAPVPPSGTVYSFTTRIPVNGGERIGLYGQDMPPGPEVFTWACAVFNASGNADRDIWGDLSAAVIGAPPAPATHGQFQSQRVPVEATLEADADNDNFGDETQDRCPTDASTQGPCPDTSPPNTTIIKGAPNETNKTQVKFKFTSDEPGSSFECSLKGKGLNRAIKRFADCSSPRKYKHLDDGKYEFEVRATDAAGNVDPSAAKDKFKIVR